MFPSVFVGGSFNSSCSAFGSCVRSTQCWDSHNPESTTANCWILVYLLLSIGFFLIITCELEYSISSVYWNFLLRCCEKQKGNKIVSNAKDGTPFTSTTRSKENFLLNHDEPSLVLPSNYSSEYEQFCIKNRSLPLRGFIAANNSIIMHRRFLNVTLGSLGIAMVCSSLSTFLWLMLDYDLQCSAQHLVQTWIEENISAMDRLVSDFKFYPILLLTAQIAVTATRWRKWMVNCHTIQGRMSDIGMLCGGSFTSPPTMQQKELLYDIYRLLNAVHAVTYFNVSPYLSVMELKDFRDKLNLLTDDELGYLSKYNRKTRDGLMVLVTNRICTLLQAENIGLDWEDIVCIVAELRRAVAVHADMFVRDNPNMYMSLMLAVVNTLLIFSIISYPFTLFVYSGVDARVMPCSQPLVLVGTFLIIFSYRSALSIIYRLRNPFSWMKDRINVDELIASTEYCLFALLRVSFTDNSAYIYPNHPSENKREERESVVASLKNAIKINNFVPDDLNSTNTLPRKKFLDEYADCEKSLCFKQRLKKSLRNLSNATLGDKHSRSKEMSAQFFLNKGREQILTLADCRDY